MKLECLQEYSEPEEQNSYEAFLRGDEYLASCYLEKHLAGLKPLYCEIMRRGIKFIRLRVVQMPLSPYLRYEFKAYSISANYGEEIFVINQGDVEELFRRTGISDFLLFDNRKMMIHRYDTPDDLQGAWCVEDKELLKEYAQFVEELLSFGTPLRAFTRQHLTKISLQ